MSDATMLAQLQTYINARVKEGFDDRTTIIENAFDYLGDGKGYSYEALEPHVESAVEAAFSQHYQEQLTWASPTDCDKLDQAFEKLNQQGIIAQQNFWCCQNCGFSAMEDLVQEQQDAEHPVRGCVFYDEQDTESVAMGHGLHLSYRGVIGEPDASVQVAYEIKAVLEAEGLVVQWDGDPKRRLFLPQFRWQRRHSVDL